MQFVSIYCEENEGTLEMIFDNGESYGICHFNNGERCEEREYYHGECSPTSNKTCRECYAPMKKRKKFYGCLNYYNNGCTYKENI